MADDIIRLNNVVALFKAETTEGTDASPATGANEFPFEVDSLEIGLPYGFEDSNEATGTQVAGAPVIINQPVTFTMRMRLKGVGAGTAYTSTVKPPHHALLQSCGLRGQFTAAVSAAALSAGSSTTATLGTGFSTTAGTYVGQRLIFGGDHAGAHAMVTGYTGSKVATLANTYGTALGTSDTAEIKANWTYAPTSPTDATARATDNPSGTLYAYCDGLLIKLFGCRGALKLSADTTKPGFFEMTGTGIWGGRTDAAKPTNAVIADHGAPIFATVSATNPHLLVNRRGLPISSFSIDLAQQLESFETDAPGGISAAYLGGRAGEITLDPLTTLVATRDHLSEFNSPPVNGYVGSIMAGSSSGNRWALTMPRLTPYKISNQRRGIAWAESLTYRMLTAGRDAFTRDTDLVLCFD